MAEMPTGSELFVDAAKRLGISHVFTLVGDHLNDVLAAAAQAGLTIVDMRHESGVTHAADAWARIHRKPALSLVTGGPGHTNSLTGIATATLAGSPLIAVSGAPAQLSRHRVVFQDVDQVSMTAPVVKWAAQASAPAQLPYLLGRAYSEASSGRMGAVHLTVPTDVFSSTAHAPLAMPNFCESPAAPKSNDVERMLAILQSAERPVVIAGSGVWWSGAAKELDLFIRRTRLPLYTITMARGMISDLYRYHFGYGDPALNRSVQTLFKQADVVLVLGKRIDSRLALGGPRLFAPSAKFLQVDIHPQELGSNRALELGICADVKVTLATANDILGKESWKALPWMRRVRQASEEWDHHLLQVADSAATEDGPIHPATFFREFRRAFPVEGLISWDGGDFVHWGRAMMPALNSGGWLRLGPMATIGAALPNAIALQMARPDRPVAMITGDGSLGFYIAELDTLVRNNLPVVVIVGNDAGWGLERELQTQLNGGSTVACELRPTRYDIVMQGFGGEGETISKVEEIAPALDRAFKSRRPYLLNVMVKGARSPFTEWQLGGKK